MAGSYGLNSSSGVAIADLLAFDRSIRAPAPLCPGPVVDRDVGPAELEEPEGQHRGSDARSARRGHRLLEVEPGRLELPAKGVAPQERAVLVVEPVVREIQAPGDVAETQAGARLGLGAGEAAGRAGVEHLLLRALHVAAHARE